MNTLAVMPDNFREALEKAREAADGKDVRIGGGERLFEGVDLRAIGYACVEFVATQKATHVVPRHRQPMGIFQC